MRSLVLHPDIPGRNIKRSPRNALDEATALAHALEAIEVVGAQVVRLPKPHAGLLFGSGKIAELKRLIDEQDIGLVLIDATVSPVQQRNLEREWKTRVLDRTGLILEIFGARARTREGVLQVDLAALAYQRSRLVRSWTHLERQRGGLGFVGGPGETQIEADRRAIDDAIVRLKRQLEKVVKTRSLHRAARKRIPYPIVALVGYTNAGKSTIFNTLTGAEVLAKDMLFATLDPTMRGLEMPSGREIILSDTVGFISDLPTQLVAAFRATLEEVLDADLIIHVRDITHPESREQADDVMEILADLGVDTTARENMIEVWNKIDLADDEHRTALVAAAERDPNIIATSAITGEGLDRLLAVVEARVKDPEVTETLELAFSEGRKRAWLFEANVVDAEVQTDTGYRLTVTWSQKEANRFRRL